MSLTWIIRHWRTFRYQHSCQRHNPLYLSINPFQNCCKHECPSPMQLIIVKENRFECRQRWWFQENSSSSICYEGTRICMHPHQQQSVRSNQQWKDGFTTLFTTTDQHAFNRSGWSGKAAAAWKSMSTYSTHHQSLSGLLWQKTITGKYLTGLQIRE